ncbi:hypothetical protein M9458_058193, partial [Cirrhinus mrigala]
MCPTSVSVPEGDVHETEAVAWLDNISFCNGFCQWVHCQLTHSNLSSQTASEAAVNEQPSADKSPTASLREKPFCPCPTGCRFYLSPNDRHNRCVHCLGHEHANAAFAEEGCQTCEDLPLSMLHLRATFFSKKLWLTSTASRSGPSTSRYEATVMCVEGERQELNDVLPGKSLQTVLPVCSPMESLDNFESSSQYGLLALLSARSRYANSPSLTTLNGGPARGYMEVPQVERAIAMHLCPQNAASLRGFPRLLSRACLPGQGSQRSARGCSRPRVAAGTALSDQLCSMSYE